MDIITIRELRVATVIGAYAWEKIITQTLTINLEILCDTAKAASSDQIADTIDYAAVAHRVTEFCKTSRFHLLESLAQAIAQLLLTEFRVAWLKLHLIKPGVIANAKEVSLTIERKNL